VSRQIVIASSNKGKLKEISELLVPLGISVLPQSAFNVADTDEPYQTFLENALTKARHASRCTGLPALADDSGLCVSSLHGAPGIHSARYAGEPRSDIRNNQKLVKALENHTQAERAAWYYCVIVVVRYPDDPQPIVADGTWHGEITLLPQGNGGFGYDPHFFLPALGRTSAELTPEDKNRISHRGKALDRLVKGIKASEWTL
jgi:XTP/dITP diphosphohydrolase